MAVRTRPVLLAVVSATAGLVALGTVVAQQPPSSGYVQPGTMNQPPSGYPPGGYNPPRTQPGSSGTLPATTVRPYGDWTPNAAPPGYVPRQPQPGLQQTGGTLPLPPGYTPVGSAGRPTRPVMAGPDGVKPAGGFDIPPPSMEVPPFRPGVGAAPPPTGPVSPPIPTPAPDSKFLLPATPAAPVPPAAGPAIYPDPKPAVPPVPPAPAPGGGSPIILPVPPSVPAAPTGLAPLAIPPGNTPPTVNPIPAAPAAPPAPGAAATAPPVTATPTLLPGRTNPSVVVEAVCPETVVFGQEFTYKLIVRNTGTAAVSYVRVEDEIPAGARYVGSDQQVEVNGDRLAWTVGTLDAGVERSVSVRVKPGEEGEIRSRATVTFAAAVDAKTRVTRPRLAVTVSGAEVARAGEETTFQIKVTNGGTGPAAKLTLQARLSDGLVHAQGLVIEAELPSLPPGETRSVPLKVNVAKAGLQSCQILVSADGSPDATAKAAVNVVEPMLVVKQTGPAHCLVRSEPTYVIELANPGTAATDPVQVHVALPDGFDYLQASDGGAANGRTVSWRLPSLAAGGTRSVSLKLRAVTASEGLMRTIAQAAPAAPANGVAGAGGVAVRPASRGLEAKTETPITAEGVAAVRFDVAVLENPIEVGKEATYEIRITNQGTGPCTNVQIAAALSEGTEFAGVGPNPPTAAKAQGLGLVFDPIPSLGVKGEAIYRVRVKGNVAGDLRFRVQLSCDQLKTPVIKEESTRFYKE